MTPLLLLLACTGDSSVTANNAEPYTPAITSHGDGDPVLPGTVELTGTVGDPDDPALDLTVTWYVDSLPGCDPAPPFDASGFTSCAVALEDAGPVEVTLFVADPFGATASSTLTLEVVPSDAPIVTIVSPSDDATFEPGDLIELSGSATDDDDDDKDLAVRWSIEPTDGSEATTIEDVPVSSDGSLELQAVTLEDPGSYLVKLFAEDPAGETGTAAVTIEVLAENVAPTCAITSPADLAVVADGEAVNFEGTVLDDDGDPEDVDVTWTSSLDGELKAGNPDTAGETSVLASTLSPGWHLVTLDAMDPRGGTCSDEVNLLVNRLPVATDVVITPDPATESDTLTCSWSYSDDDGETEASTVAWTVDGVAAGTGTTLSGAFAEGSVVQCTVTPHDGQQAGDDVSSAELTINTRPALTDVTISPDPAVAGDTLTCAWSGWSDADGDADQSTLEWTVNGVSVGTSATLGTGVVGGDTVSCTVTPDDGVETGEAVVAVLVVDNTAPVLADVTLSPDPAVEADTLACTPGTTTDADGTGVFTYSYGWTVDGIGLTETGSTLTGDHFDKGQSVACKVTPHDGTESGTAVGSNTVTIDNTAPSVTDVTISPESPTSADDLSCTWTFSDDDGDSDGSSVIWTSGSSVLGTGETLTAGSASAGDVVRCTVTPSDGSTTGAAASTEVTLSNSPPTLTSVSVVSTGETVEGETLTCTPGSVTDLDGDSVTYAYTWSVSGSDPGVTDADLDSSHWAKGDTVTCTATPFDGTDWGSEVTSSAVTIVNSPPGAPAISVLPEDPVPGTDDLQCFVDLDSADADGDSVTYTFAWEVDGTAFTGSAATTDHAGDTVPAVNTETDQTWTCTATPNDGEEDGVSATAEVSVSCVLVTWYADADGDGYGDPSAANEDCEELQPSSYVSDGTDCDDSAANVNPGETEVCDGVDNDCDVSTPEDSSADASTWYADGDGDGYGDASSTTLSCSLPSGHTADATDCDDGEVTVNPGETEVCDGLDNDCDSSTLEDDSADAATWYADDDGDGYGDATSTTVSCSEPSGYSDDDTDCDDTDASVWAVETWYLDFDGDGYGNSSFTTESCGEPSGYVDNTDDCDDGDASVNPDLVWYEDSDGDGFGSPDSTTTACEEPSGYSADDSDCDDTMDSSGMTTGCPWVEVSVGEGHSCALALDGTVSCWGNSSNGETTVPSGTYTTVDAGVRHTCALASDGTAVCWGYDANGESTPPSGTFDDIAAGYQHSCATTSSGSVTCWGNNTHGQTTTSGSPTHGLHSYYDHTCGIDTTTGTERACWGRDDYGQSGSSGWPGGFKAYQISAGGIHSCAVDSSGNIWCWGNNDYGQTSDGGGRIEFVAAGMYHSCGIEWGTQTVKCWGWDNDGQSSPPGGTFSTLSAGHYHTCGITTAGDLDCWGYNADGQCDHP